MNIKEAKEENPKAFVLCGGNANEANIMEILNYCDGAIVSSCLKNAEKTAWDENKIKRFVEHARS